MAGCAHRQSTPTAPFPLCLPAKPVSGHYTSRSKALASTISTLTLYHIFHCLCCSPKKIPSFVNSYECRSLSKLLLLSNTSCMLTRPVHLRPFSSCSPKPQIPEVFPSGHHDLRQGLTSSSMAGNPDFGYFTEPLHHVLKTDAVT